MSEHWISEEDWNTIVANSPIVSVDLLVRYKDGLLFGKRTNKPAKGYWFLPGGRVQKGETRCEAVDRIAKEELGLSVEIVESLGAFEHIYETSDVDSVATKHYLANGYVVDVISGEPQADDQHEDIQIFDSAPEPLHENIHEYLDESKSLTSWP
ncbi:NUDIX domain-containing protein [Halorubrum sp. T3]|uniref:NUDIX domain-containing protein n=1 Tax=Halorubrum sp. T3 TaxID=1194088 RepID=UPI0009E27A8F|nr:NUDIX domain-containing protein [Halorubrum sp. T3]